MPKRGAYGNRGLLCSEGSQCLTLNPDHLKSESYTILRMSSKDQNQGPSRCVRSDEISLGARSKRDLVAFLSKKSTFRSNLGLQALLIRFWALCSLEIASGIFPQDSERVFPSVQGPQNCFLIPNHSQIMNSPKTDK